jgi:uncharacterized membrane protein YfcA
MSLELALLIVAIGIVVGVFSAMFGVGGGTIIVPFVVLALDESQHLAEGTSLLAIVPIAVVGVAAHRSRGLVSFRRAGWVSLGGIVGVVMGVRLALIFDADLLQLIFGAFIVVVGLRLLLQGVRASRRFSRRA